VHPSCSGIPCRSPGDTAVVLVLVQKMSQSYSKVKTAKKRKEKVQAKEQAKEKQNAKKLKG